MQIHSATLRLKVIKRGQDSQAAEDMITYMYTTNFAAVYTCWMVKAQPGQLGFHQAVGLNKPDIVVKPQHWMRSSPFAGPRTSVVCVTAPMRPVGTNSLCMSARLHPMITGRLPFSTCVAYSVCMYVCVRVCVHAHVCMHVFLIHGTQSCRSAR